MRDRKKHSWTFFQSHMLHKGQMGLWPAPASVSVTVKRRYCVGDGIQHTQAAFISTAMTGAEPTCTAEEEQWRPESGQRTQDTIVQITTH